MVCRRAIKSERVQEFKTLNLSQGFTVKLYFHFNGCFINKTRGKVSAGVKSWRRASTYSELVFPSLMGNARWGQKWERAAAQSEGNILVMRRFLPKEDVSLSSQHAYYSAPFSGLIKTRWNDEVFNGSRERGGKLWGESVCFLNDTFEDRAWFTRYTGCSGILFYHKALVLSNQHHKINVADI